ncbi:unnamed protein product [Debaryomyces fabryi]|nr:unnamed protein product [Debaryomyces fabryi]
MLPNMAMPMMLLLPIRPPARQQSQTVSKKPSRTQSVRRSNSHLSDKEIEVVQRIWGSLDMYLEEDADKQAESDCIIHQVVPKLTVLEVQVGKKSKNLKSTAHREFEVRLQKNIYLYFKSHYRSKGSPYSTLTHYGNPEDFLFDLHLPAVLKMLTILIWQMEDGETTMREARNESTYIWRFESWHYNLIGEGIVATILEMLGRDNFSQENEYTWIKFYNKIANRVQSEAQT